jgi:2-iminobutanoate/2-iminopropanoate deaminase
MKQIISPHAPAAIGPYCHAMIHDNLVYCSGQIGLDPKTMEVAGETIKEQTVQVMKNIEAVLKAADSRLDRIIKTTIFLNNMDDFSDMNNVYEAYLSGHKPARSTIEAGKLPKNVLIEIDCIAAC